MAFQIAQGFLYYIASSVLLESFVLIVSLLEIVKQMFLWK